MTIHKEGYPTLLFSFIFLAIINIVVHTYLYPLFPFFAFISIILYLFLISFFRRPDRSVSILSDTDILSPCDGKVVVIEQVYEPEFLKADCLQVSVFMSPLNVHINWHPINGEILYSKYHPGKFLAAWNPKASTENERTTVAYGVRTNKIVLRQVAGALARRIVCYAKSGNQATQGGEMGFIKFGSRVDLYLPLDTKLNVQLDQVVTGNRTVLATLPK
ncbi:MAG TPA: phosphatidylserine decarboxylase family protein [Saprospiraceae bacterium]|jgi:phosphatidylserine decarboxylase|nr:phosphatidylserine decarboxylase family protein [Saprospiraceae bacterium]MBK9742361.1 phosphatidylserine decarboxylase family protein [Saprospiraceae bacterium]MBP6539214.1 phosphatidylserine decarboxylase family protein [Saprospiraceae bacterium]HQV96172.1 phosphatidylserine decarboxylase family protein [Saprospiraceae bacterium]